MIEVGDLVRIQGADWLGKQLAIVTEVKKLIHERSRESYVVVTAVSEGKTYTFSEADFELVTRIERKKK